jgi:hypothetical protein
MSNLSEIVKGIELGDFLFEPAIMDIIRVMPSACEKATEVW